MDELAPGLRHWTANLPHAEPNSEPGTPADRPPEFGCVAYAADDTPVLIDPLVPLLGLPVERVLGSRGRPVLARGRVALARAPT